MTLFIFILHLKKQTNLQLIQKHLQVLTAVECESELIGNANPTVYILNDIKIIAFTTDRSGATGVQLTGDELRFQHFSAPTHPTGYMWEEKQVKCKVKILRKIVHVTPVKQFNYNSSTKMTPKSTCFFQLKRLEQIRY